MALTHPGQAPQTMSYPDRAPEYLAQYRLVPDLLRGPYSPDAGDEVLAFLLCRDALNSAAEYTAEFQVVDGEVTSALAGAPAPWPDKLEAWAMKSGFADAAWWVAVHSAATRARSEAVG